MDDQREDREPSLCKPDDVPAPIDDLRAARSDRDGRGQPPRRNARKRGVSQAALARVLGAVADLGLTISKLKYEHEESAVTLVFGELDDTASSDPDEALDRWRSGRGNGEAQRR